MVSMNEQFRERHTEPAPSEVIHTVQQTLDIIASFKIAAESAAHTGAAADPNSWKPRAMEYLASHAEACRELYRTLWAEYVRNERKGGRRLASIKRAEKQPVDCPTDPLYEIVNSAILKLEGGNNTRIIDGILDDCETGVLDCEPQ